MGDYVKSNSRDAHIKSQRGTEESATIKWLLIGVALFFTGAFLLLPLINVFAQALSKGFAAYKNAFIDPDTLAAIKLTLTVAAISVPLNVTFGLAAAWAIAKFRFRGRAFLVTLIDLPFSVSPVVAGLIFVVLFGLQGYFGEWLDARDIKIIFAVPGIVIATVFITFPFVARELIPVMQATGTEQEEAALTLGAGGWRTFWHVTLPSVKWGLLYGVILCNARAMGEFGAVSVVSGHIAGVTDTMPLRVEKLYHEYNSTAAFTVASLLALLALFTLGIKSVLEWKQQRAYEGAQRQEPSDGFPPSGGSDQPSAPSHPPSEETRQPPSTFRRLITESPKLLADCRKRIADG
jgi:sulfate transport system permease protein